MGRTGHFWTRAALVALTALWAIGAGGLRAADTLDIYFVDPGGAVGNATVIVSPSGETAMLDAGPAVNDQEGGRGLQAGRGQADRLSWSTRITTPTISAARPPWPK